MKLKCNTRHNHLKNIFFAFIVVAGIGQAYAAAPASDTLSA